MIEPFKDYGDFVNHKNERIICFNVSRTYLGCERPNLYECTRKYWRLNGQRAKKADLVFALWLYCWNLQAASLVSYPM